MRGWKSWLLLLMAGPAMAADEGLEINAVSRAWDRYAELSSRDDPASADLLAASSLAHFGFLRDAALHASVEQLRRLPIADRVVVYALRATQTPDALKALDEKAAARLCFGRGWYGVGAPAADGSLPALSHVTLLGENHAIGEMAPPTGQQFQFGAEFFRDDDGWKVAPETLIADASASILQQARNASLGENAMLGYLLQRFLGEDAPMPSLVALEQPFIDDVAARARLNENWPAYEATYKTRVQALGVKAEAGDTFAQMALGTLLVSGSLPQAAAKDEPRGWKLLEQASDGGNSDAAWYVFQHLMADPKQYTDARLTQAATHLQRAAAAANPPAMAVLGHFYFEGVGGLPQDCRQAADWQARAEEAGVPDARNDQVWTWATCPIAAQRDPARALQLAGFMVRQQDTLGYGELDTVAAAYAANGQFDRAIEFQRKSLDKLAATDMDKKLRNRMQKRLQARLRGYQNGRNYVLDYNTFKEMTAGNY
ncbi:MAG: hypothetical protein QM599_11940 [Pseudoxanthomonas sp.]